MDTAIASAHNLIVALYNEVHASIEADLSKEPSKSLFTFRGSQFKEHLQELAASESRCVGQLAFHAYTSQVSLRRVNRTCYFFYESLPSDTDLFRLVVIVRRPGMLDAIIEDCADKLRREMLRYDVDEAPVTIEYVPLSIYSVLYPESIAATYLAHVANEVAQRLSHDRIKVSINNHDSFECRRS